MTNAIELNDVNFDSEVKRSTLPVLVDFSQRGADLVKNSFQLWTMLQKSLPAKFALVN